MQTFFSLKAKSFQKSQYQRKIQYVSTRLVGGPGQWWIANKGIVDGSGEAGTIWGSYEEFLAELKLSFDNPNRLEEARDSLDTLIQGDEKTAAFLAKFRALPIEARFTVNELWSRLWSAVHQKTRDELKRTRTGISKYNGAPTTEEGCYNLMHQAGRAVEESEREKKVSEARTMAFKAFKNKGQFGGNQSGNKKPSNQSGSGKVNFHLYK